MVTKDECIDKADDHFRDATCQSASWYLFSTNGEELGSSFNACPLVSYDGDALEKVNIEDKYDEKR